MDTSDVVTPEKEAPQRPPAMNVGMALREARERLGMSVNDIAERIKFAPRQVEALEANDFAHLPQATFLRGFVRSYARVLQLDEAALIAALPPVEPSPQVVARTPVLDVSFPSMLSLRRVNVLWLAGALGIALVLALFVSLYDGAPATQTEIVVEALPLPAPEGAVSAVAAARPDEIAQAPADAKADEPAEPADEKKNVAATQIAAVSAPAAATVKPPVPLEQLKRRPLHFVFSEDAWAEVIDVNGEILLSRTNPRGSEKWIGGPRRAPYDITIAHPDTVKLYYRGKEIDLTPYAGMETARLKVE
jgi:cytoskeleton protein RodZ